MSRETLLAALRRDAQQLLDELAARGKEQAAALAREGEERLVEMQAKEERRRVELAALERQTALARSRHQALAARLAGEERLQQRLFALARQLLAELATEDSARLLAALAEEIPAAEWHTATVHPRDEEDARRHFPQAQVSGDAAVSGGVRVADRSGRIVVDNTLEKRLARGWPELLPALLRELEVPGAAASD